MGPMSFQPPPGSGQSPHGMGQGLGGQPVDPKAAMRLIAMALLAHAEHSQPPAQQAQQAAQPQFPQLGARPPMPLGAFQYQPQARPGGGYRP